MDRQKLKKIIDIVNEMLKINEDVFEEIGVRLSYCGARFSRDGGGVLKIEIVEKNEDGTENSLESSNYKAMCRIYGLTEDLLGKKCNFRGSEFTLVGLRPKGKRYPIVMQRSDGKKFKFSIISVKQAYKIGNDITI